jgi:hypothetical protein
MLLRRVPMILVGLGVIVFAFIRWKSGPRAALLTVIAFAIYFIDMVLFTAFLYWLPEMTGSWRWSSSAREWLDWIIFFCEDFVTAVFVILLTVAAFVGRRRDSIPETA